MVVFLILFYFLVGVLMSCFYNMFHSVPSSLCDMTEDEKRMAFLIIETWPFMIVFWLVRETVKTIIWGISKLKK